MNSQLPTSNSQKETTKDTKRSKSTKNFSGLFFVIMSASVFFVNVVVQAQQLLDRVVARVGTSAITQTDVDAAVAFGVVEQRDAEGRDAVKQLIDRRLILAEVERFPPPEPAEASIVEQVAKMRATAGANTAAVMKRTGVDDKRLAEIARDTLRIQDYMRQRFGTGVRADQQMTKWIVELRARGDVTELSPRP